MAKPADPALAIIDAQKMVANAFTTIRSLTDRAWGETNPDPIEMNIAHCALRGVEDQFKEVFTALAGLAEQEAHGEGVEPHIVASRAGSRLCCG